MAPATAKPPATALVARQLASLASGSTTTFVAQDAVKLPQFGPKSVVAAIEAVKAGKIIVVTDDEDRENEGDLIMAAEFAPRVILCCAHALGTRGIFTASSPKKAASSFVVGSNAGASAQPAAGPA